MFPRDVWLQTGAGRLWHPLGHPSCTKFHVLVSLQRSKFLRIVCLLSSILIQWGTLCHAHCVLCSILIQWGTLCHEMCVGSEVEQWEIVYRETEVPQDSATWRRPLGTLSPLWGPQDGTGYVATLTFAPIFGVTETTWVILISPSFLVSLRPVGLCSHFGFYPLFWGCPRQ